MLGVLMIIAGAVLTAEEFKADTGEPAPAALRSSSILQPFAAAEYERLADAIAKDGRLQLVRITEKPEDLTDRARFGMNVSLAGVNRSWIWDRIADHDVLYLDLDADGAFDEAERFEFASEQGQSVVRVSHLIEEHAPLELKFTISEATMPGASKPSPVLLLADTMVCRGRITLPAGAIAFALLSEGGVYDSPYATAYFDLDGNGRFDFDDQHSAERFKLSDRHVTIGAATYLLAVDRYGRNITLQALAESAPQRADLTVGRPAPEFAGTDIDGKARALSDYRGKVVLLDFWSMGCGPCVEEIPSLVQAYAKYHERGFEILGINGDGNATVLREFMAKKNMTWPQIGEAGREGPIGKLYRIEAYPNYWLIDQQGVIHTLGARGPSLAPYLEKLLAKK